MSWVGMSKRELNRIDILARLDSGRLTKAEFAEQLLRVWEGIVNLTDFTCSMRFLA